MADFLHQKRKKRGKTTKKPSSVDPSYIHPSHLVQRAQANPRSLSPEQVLQLQRTYGNRAVGRLLRGNSKTAPVQPKLQVGPANDKYEQEADQIADTVMRTPTPIQRMEEREQLQMKSDSTIQRMDDEEELLQMKSISPLQRDGGGEGFELDSEFQNKLSSSGGGSPLPSDIQAEFGAKMGADLSGVRIHTDNKAAKLNTQIQAKAFTHGKDIYMGAGQYNPNSSEGKRLLAHEATHTIQQGGVQSQNGNTSTVQRDVIQREGDDSSSSDDMLKKVLNNEMGLKLLSNFAKKEWSYENIEAWLAITAYEKKPTRSKAIAIYDKYIDSKAAKQINLPGEAVAPIKHKIEGPYGYKKQKAGQKRVLGINVGRLGRAFEKGHAGDPNLFAPAKKDVLINISDTYTRFVTTEEGKYIVTELKKTRAQRLEELLKEQGMW